MGRNWADVAELAGLVEQYMLQGYTTPSSLMRVKVLKDKGLTRFSAGRFIDAVTSRWHKQLSGRSLDERRSQLVQMHLHTLRQTYVLLAQLQQSTSTTANAEANKAIGNITRILASIADLQGLRERVVRVGGDREGVPIKSEVQQETLILQAMVDNGQLDADTAATLDAAIIAARTSASALIPGSVWSVDAEPRGLPAPSGDHQGSPTG